MSSETAGLFDTLVSTLRNIQGVQFADYEWRTRPDGDFGTVQLDFETLPDDGDDTKVDRAFEGSVDLYTHGKQMMTVAAVESALATVCGASWYLNSEQYEHETGLIHRDFVFQLERR